MNEHKIYIEKKRIYIYIYSSLILTQSLYMLDFLSHECVYTYYLVCTTRGLASVKLGLVSRSYISHMDLFVKH